MIHTSYYACRRLDRSRHYLVRTSIGAPRFVRCDEVCPELAPERAWIGLSAADYRPLYEARLEEIGAVRLERRLAEMERRAAAMDREPVLLCFEALHPKQVGAGQFCHRRLLADWCASRLGILLREL